MFSFNDIHPYSKDLNVLYVEDDAGLLEETRELFDDFFNNVITAVNGEDGVLEYKKYKEENNVYPDLIITDINMPKMNGIEMIEHILDINSEQFVIVVSAYNDSDKLIKMIELGVSSFIMKPMNQDNLMKILYKTCKSLVSYKQKEAYLIQQSKLASMGEMIDFIAHQWLQPIHIIKLQTDLLELTNMKNEVDKATIEDYIKVHVSQIKLIVETLQEFRRFFRIDNGTSVVSYKNLVEKTVLLLSSKLKNKVDVIIDIDETKQTEIIINQFKHVLINIINNAIDAFEENDIKDKKLIFNLEEKDEYMILGITDNAGGIPDDVIDNIFKAYFTTKKTGTGVGLYLSNLILEKIGGKLTVENVENGAKFSILLKK